MLYNSVELCCAVSMNSTFGPVWMHGWFDYTCGVRHTPFNDAHLQPYN